MRYRVIKRTEADGRTWYYPQYKRWFRWRYFYKDFIAYGEIIGVSNKPLSSERAEDAFAFLDKKPLQNIIVKEKKYEVH